jgi:glycosyltransferase involved in cell wall biosynthesis
VAIPELKDGENVLLVSPSDPQALCEAACRLEEDEALRRRIGEGARALSATFTWEQIARRTVDEVFRPLLER